MEPILQCKNLNIAYNGHTVVKDVSFDVFPGEYLCIVGENGSGKSSLLKGILNLVPLKNGTVSFSDEAISGIGYLPQQSMVQHDFPASVEEVVLLGCLKKAGKIPFFRKKEKKLAEENMKQLHIYDIRKKSYRELSGGQQQRVLLARALCSAEKILLLDEPVTGLDPLVSAELYSIIHSLNHERNLTVVMVSHDISSATSYADKILHLNEKAEFFGNVDEYLQSDLGRHFSKGV